MGAASKAKLARKAQAEPPAFKMVQELTFARPTDMSPDNSQAIPFDD